MTETMTAAEYQATGGKAPTVSKSEAIARTFALHIRARKLPEPRSRFHAEGELRFMAGEVITRQNRRLKRKQASPSWRFDFAWPELMVAVEIEGVTVRKGADGKTQLGGRHAHITGFKDDCEKYAWAAVMGWRVLRFEQSQVTKGFAVDMLVRLVAALGVEVKPGNFLLTRDETWGPRATDREQLERVRPIMQPTYEPYEPRNITNELDFGGKLDRDPF